MELLTELHVIFGQINLQSIMMGALWKSVKGMAYFMGTARLSRYTTRKTLSKYGNGNRLECNKMEQNRDLE